MYDMVHLHLALILEIFFFSFIIPPGRCKMMDRICALCTVHLVSSMIIRTKIILWENMNSIYNLDFSGIWNY